MKTNKTNTLNLSWFVKNITSVRFRHRYRALVLVLICFGIHGLSQAAAAVSPFHIGERVRTIRQSAIYLAPPLAGQFLKAEPVGVQGAITEGPVRSADVWWWKVRFDEGADGWVAERQIRNLEGQVAGPRINSSTQGLPSAGTGNDSGEFANLNPADGSTVGSRQIVLRGTVTDDHYAPWLISFSVNGSPI